MVDGPSLGNSGEFVPGRKPLGDSSPISNDREMLRIVLSKSISPQVMRELESAQRLVEHLIQIWPTTSTPGRHNTSLHDAAREAIVDAVYRLSRGLVGIACERSIESVREVRSSLDQVLEFSKDLSHVGDEGAKRRLTILSRILCEVAVAIHDGSRMKLPSSARGFGDASSEAAFRRFDETDPWLAAKLIFICQVFELATQTAKVGMSSTTKMDQSQREISNPEVREMQTALSLVELIEECQTNFGTGIGARRGVDIQILILKFARDWAKQTNWIAELSNLPREIIDRELFAANSPWWGEIAVARKEMGLALGNVLRSDKRHEVVDHTLKAMVELGAVALIGILRVLEERGCPGRNGSAGAEATASLGEPQFMLMIQGALQRIADRDFRFIVRLREYRISLVHKAIQQFHEECRRPSNSEFVLPLLKTAASLGRDLAEVQGLLLRIARGGGYSRPVMKCAQRLIDKYSDSFPPLH